MKLIPVGSIVKVINSKDTPFYEGQILKVISEGYGYGGGRPFIGIGKTQDIRTGNIYRKGWLTDRFEIIEEGKIPTLSSLDRFKKIKEKINQYRKGGK